MSQFHGSALLPSVKYESHSVNRRLEGPVGWPYRAGPGLSAVHCRSFPSGKKSCKDTVSWGEDGIVN